MTDIPWEYILPLALLAFAVGASELLARRVHKLINRLDTLIAELKVLEEDDLDWQCQRALERDLFTPSVSTGVTSQARR